MKSPLSVWLSLFCILDGGQTTSGPKGCWEEHMDGDGCLKLKFMKRKKNPSVHFQEYTRKINSHWQISTARAPNHSHQTSLRGKRKGVEKENHFHTFSQRDATLLCGLNILPITLLF